MPVSEYFKGKGNKVMRSMRKTYGNKAKKIFYATANKRGMATDANPDADTRTYTISAPADVLARFERFLALVQWCGGVGHSTVCGLSIDGDGSDSFEVEQDLPKVDEDKIVTHGNGQGGYETLSEDSMAKAKDCMDNRARMHAALDRVINGKRKAQSHDDHDDEGWGEGSGPSQPYHDANRGGARDRLHAALDKMIERKRKAKDRKAKDRRTAR